jgi:hypothetical protein
MSRIILIGNNNNNASLSTQRVVSALAILKGIGGELRHDSKRAYTFRGRATKSYI